VGRADGGRGHGSGLLRLTLNDFLDVLYADLARDLDSDARAELDAQLAMPLTVTSQQVAAGTAAWQRAIGG
jgi:hypothetical protein